MKTRRILLAAAAVALATAGLTGTASAASAGTEPAAKQCLVSDGRATCFDSLDALVAHATDGQVTKAPSTAARAAADRGADVKIDLPEDGVGTQDLYRDAIIWEHRYRGDNGGSYAEIWFNGPCIEDGARDFGIPDVRNVSGLGQFWNDRVSSFQGYWTCDINAYEHSSYTGDSTSPRRYMDSMGDMNDEMTSLTFG